MKLGRRSCWHLRLHLNANKEHKLRKHCCAELFACLLCATPFECRSVLAHHTSSLQQASNTAHPLIWASTLSVVLDHTCKPLHACKAIQLARWWQLLCRRRGMLAAGAMCKLMATKGRFARHVQSMQCSAEAHLMML